MPHDMITLESLGAHTPAMLDDPELFGLYQDAKDYWHKNRADSTRRCYERDYAQFAAWCAFRRLVPLPASPQTLALHFAWLAKRGKRGTAPVAASSVGRRVAAIVWKHRQEGHPHPIKDEPTLQGMLGGIRRDLGTAPKTRKAAATADRIRQMLDTCPDTILGKRDRAVLALGFAGAFRRSELAALRVEDVAHVKEGLRVLVRRSKGDQQGQGQEVVIPHGASLLPVRAVDDWLAAAGITEGPLLRALHRGGRVQAEAMRGADIARVVKKRAQMAGLDPAEFSGHSLRAGFATSAAEAGAPVLRIMETTRHKSADMLAIYVRRADAFKDHAGAKFL